MACSRYNQYSPLIDPQTGFSHVASTFVGPQHNSRFGVVDSRHENLGSYVPAAVYTSGCLPGAYTNDYATRSMAKKLPNPLFRTGEVRGLSSRDVHAAGTPWSDPYQFGLSKGDPFLTGVLTVNPYLINEDHFPFDDTVIDAPRDVAYTDQLWGGTTVITQKSKNATRDIRGDIAPDVSGGVPIGAGMATIGAFNVFHPYRPYVV
jgi:hypothetical protein